VSDWEMDMGWDKEDWADLVIVLVGCGSIVWFFIALLAHLATAGY